MTALSRRLDAAPPCPMQYRPLGATDVEVSALCLGTQTFGAQTPEAEAHAQLDLAFEHGVTFVDTAEMYPFPPDAETAGATETIVGNWLRERRRRHDDEGARVEGRVG